MSDSEILSHLKTLPTMANLSALDDISRFARDLNFNVKYKGNRGRFYSWFKTILNSPQYGDSLTYALAYQNGNNVADSDDLLRSLTAAGVIRPTGLGSSFSTRAFIGLERRKSGGSHYAREFMYEACKGTPELASFISFLDEDRLDRLRALLCGVKVLYRDNTGSLGLWGIPYNMKPGQQPADLWRSTSIQDTCAQAEGWIGVFLEAPGPREDWLYLGHPGWFGSYEDQEHRIISEFLKENAEFVPTRPNEWDVIVSREKRPSSSFVGSTALASFLSDD